MLRALTIRDFVIVDTLELEFNASFSVLSGETGAGKSILLDAIGLTLGERADVSMVRGHGTPQAAARAEIIAEFATTPQTEAWLATQELDAQDAVILRRVVDGSGRPKAWINGMPATLTQLRELGDMLVDIHGQHAHQLLLRTDAQRRLLDEQAGLSAEARALTEFWTDWQKIIAQRKRIESDARGLEVERERLEWQVEELSRLGLKPGEWDSIQQEHQRLAHAASLIEGAQQAVTSLSEADGAIQERLAAIIHKLRHLGEVDPALKAILESLEPAQIQIQDAVYGLNDYLSEVELDPERLAQVEQRIDAIHSTARKFRLAPDALAAELDSLSTRLAALQGATDLDALNEAEQAAQASWRKAATSLGKARAKAAAALSAAVTEGMQSLNMSGGQFKIALNPCEPSAHGLEQIEFLVAAHPGAPLRPLAKVASGGELARISLAISVIASAASTVPTLIFDEVDSGIGGAVAEVVGRLLRQLGRMRQVLCVTHLPQVAAQGDGHFAVSKETLSGETLSRITPLTGNARVDEIARMLGGIDITSTTRKHARELLALAG